MDDAPGWVAATHAAAKEARRRRAMLVVGLASLANGAALVLHIVGGLPLPVLLVVVWAVALLALTGFAVSGRGQARWQIVRLVLVSVTVGLVSTLAYDLTKLVLSQLDPSPYNPFEATRAFGALLVGDAASQSAVAAAGWTFHLANGCTFTIAYAALFARDGRVSLRRGVITGVVWALMLETIQLLLYPGWLDIRFVDEFRQISFASHIVFGLGIGILVPAGLRRGSQTARWSKGVEHG